MLNDLSRNQPVGADAEPFPGDDLGGCFEVAKGALSDNTERALRADLAIYAAWCRERGLTPVPAGPNTIAAYIDHMAASRAPATVRRYVSSIAAAHRSVGLGKTLQSATVKLAMQRMHRRKGRRQAQAAGLTWSIRQRLMEAAGDRLIDVRNRALLALAYDTLLRRSELAALLLTDLMVESQGAATVLVRRAKTDAEGCGAMVYLACDSVELVRDWLEKSGIARGRVFRSLRGGVIGEQLHASQIPRIYKGMARQAGLPEEVVAGLSGHSTRIGATQDMIACGIEMPAILQAGRWKTTAMVTRYGERLLARRSGSAQLARLQRRE